MLEIAVGSAWYLFMGMLWYWLVPPKHVTPEQKPMVLIIYLFFYPILIGFVIYYIIKGVKNRD